MKRIAILIFLCLAQSGFAYGDLAHETEYDLVRSWAVWPPGDACNMMTQTAADVIGYAIRGIPFVFKDMTEIPGFSRYNVITDIPKDAMYMTMWKRMTPESRTFFSEMMKPSWEFGKKKLDELGPEKALEYDFDSFLNSAKFECIVTKTFQMKNQREEHEL